MYDEFKRLSDVMWQKYSVYYQAKYTENSHDLEKAIFALARDEWEESCDERAHFTARFSREIVKKWHLTYSQEHK